MQTSLDLPYIAFSLVAALIALSIHEFSHGFAAYKLGDNTALYQGRLTLNPLRHIDPVGVVFMILFRFGWAKPVPVNTRNFKNPRRDYAITALAGPLSNILSAFLSTGIYLLFLKFYVLAGKDAVILYNAARFFAIFSALNIGLGVFNLIPVPPFDGSRIVYLLLPEKIYWKVQKCERYIYWGVIAWLFLGKYIYSGLMSISTIANIPVLPYVLRILDLSGLIGDAISFLHSAIISFWQLIPFLNF